MKKKLLPHEYERKVLELLYDKSKSDKGVDVTDIKRAIDFVMAYNECDLSDEENNNMHRRIESKVVHKRNNISWCNVFAKDEINWHEKLKQNRKFKQRYWGRYERYLLHIKGMPFTDIKSIDVTTNEIVAHLEDPNKEEAYNRRGLVVGQIQSGKTANYIGVINKAVDCGYKVIIVLAGSVNALRNQTQVRIDEGFLGRNSSTNESDGVGELSGFDTIIPPICLTTNKVDFGIQSANQFDAKLFLSPRAPIIFVIKKNKSIMENLLKWLKSTRGASLKKLPFLLIDDEADYASINTKKVENATLINKRLRQILTLFSHSCYIGYTATPFANILIDSDARNDLCGDDLFPRDFIVTLDSSSNYIGPRNVFLSENEHGIIRTIKDNEDVPGTGILPVGHKKTFNVDKLPPSLIEALDSFIIAKAIRLARGQTGKHHSVMIHVSRYKRIHKLIFNLICEEIENMRNAILNTASLPNEISMQGTIVKRLFSVYQKEYIESDVDWCDILCRLTKSVETIEVITVNSEKDSEKLDYTKENYPDGRTLVVIGGMSLSRGLTIEGLIISYFLRSSSMYDTLMQMGRWFGYRIGFSDLCRVYMSSTVEAWYRYIAESMDELVYDFKQMSIKKATPQEFGLRMKAHPANLLVTAKNKMKYAKEVVMEVDLEGRNIETTFLSSNEFVLQENRTLFNEFIVGLGTPNGNAAPLNGFFWKNIPHNKIMNFISRFKSSPKNQLIQSSPLCSFIESLARNGQEEWNIYLPSPQDSASNVDVECLGDFVFNRENRTIAIKTDEETLAINGEKRRVGYAEQEAAGLLHYFTKEELDSEKKDFLNQYASKSVSGKLYRALRAQRKAGPLLTLHLIDGKDKNVPINEIKRIVAYSISFPGNMETMRSSSNITYVVNTIWLKNKLKEEGRNAQ